ncbi:MAG: Lrp/AsnC ligand binding domain-containing protein [Methanotrichaceae archaeon]|nr:Lrp/AsnC ligand binding domain-containing protein [Methanotrichaceae archaeon]
MIKVKPGHEKSVYKVLQAKIGVKDVYHLFGEYSFFLILQTEGRTKLNQLVQDIKEEDRVIGTGPIMLANNGLTDSSLGSLH